MLRQSSSDSPGKQLPCKITMGSGQSEFKFDNSNLAEEFAKPAKLNGRRRFDFVALEKIEKKR